jgi:hypothetical protein
MVAKARVKVPSFKKKSVSIVSPSLRVSKFLFFCEKPALCCYQQPSVAGGKKKEQINFSFSAQTKIISFVT